jgi:hypothetical protein
MASDQPSTVFLFGNLEVLAGTARQKQDTSVLTGAYALEEKTVSSAVTSGLFEHHPCGVPVEE